MDAQAEGRRIDVNVLTCGLCGGAHRPIWRVAISNLILIS